MVKIFFNIFFNVIYSILDFILTPVNSLVNTLLPDLSVLISNFNNFMNIYIGGTLAFFGNLIPPITKAMILLYLGYLVGRMIVILNVHVLLTIFKAIKNIKIW